MGRINAKGVCVKCGSKNIVGGKGELKYCDECGYIVNQRKAKKEWKEEQDVNYYLYAKNRAGSFHFKGRYTLRGINGRWYVYDRELGTTVKDTGEHTFTKAEKYLLKNYPVELDAKSVRELSNDDFKEIKQKFGASSDKIIANQLRYRSKITEHPFFSDKNIEEINESSAGGGYYKVYMVTVTNPRTKFGDDLYIVKVVEKWGEPRITQVGKVKDRFKGWTNLVGEGLDRRNLKIIDIDAKRIMELGNSDRLEIQQAITVPSTEYDKPISRERFKERVDEVQKYLASTFGGETTVSGQGGYVAESGELIPEKVNVVTSFADDKDFEQNIGKVYQKIKKWKDKWKQESIAYQVEDDLYIVK